MALIVFDANGTKVALPAPVDAVYHASKAAVAAVSSATDILQLQGSATKIVRILKASVSLTSVSTGATQPVSFFRRSSAWTGGTPAALVLNTDIAQHDINDPAMTAVLSKNTGTAATAGTLAGIFKAEQVAAGAATVAGVPVVFNALSGGEKPIILRGTSDFFTVGFGGTTPGGTVNWEICWSESDT